MGSELARELRRACEAIDPDVNLYFGETCAAGVAAVAIVMRGAQHVRHVITPTLQAALVKALASPHSVQYLLDDPALLARVGIAFDGKHVSFAK
jgi:hypothetical protein